MNDRGLARDKSIKHGLKVVRWKLRRARVAFRWGSEALSRSPAVLGNAMPKSGSHLIIQVLQGLVDVGPFVNPGFPPVNRSEDNRILSPNAVLANILAMKPGDIGYGYVQACEPFVSALSKPGLASIFVYRDPRDMIVSHVYYATDMHTGHGMHRYYTEELTSMEERIDAAIHGVKVEGLEMRGVAARYEDYLGWLEVPSVLCIRFEDLIEKQGDTLARILEYLEGQGYAPQMEREEAVKRIKSAINPGRSGTFRKGKPGNWRDLFTEVNKSSFKQSAGDLLIRLGYERDSSW